MTNSTAVARREDTGAVAERRQPAAVRFVEMYRDRLEPFAVSAGVSLERVAAELAVVAQANPQVLRCTPESVLRAISNALALGFQIGSEYHLVPFNERVKVGNQWEKKLVCTGIPDYKAMAALAVACGAARSVDARCVYENEHFRIEKGLNEVLEHHPITDASKRGKMIGAYYVVRLPRYAHLFDFLPIADIEEVRAKSKQWNPTKVPVCPAWWAKKRATIVGLKLIPKNPRYAKMLRVVEVSEVEEFGTPEALPAPERRAIAAPREVDADEVPAMSYQVSERDDDEPTDEEIARYEDDDE